MFNKCFSTQSRFIILMATEEQLKILKDLEVVVCDLLFIIYNYYKARTWRSIASTSWNKNRILLEW